MWSGIFVILISLGLVSSQSNWVVGLPRVKTEFGDHQGVWTVTYRGEHVASYLGIPYAKPPIGALRFQKPSPWTEQRRRLWDATKYPSPCLPYGGYEIGSEDCLYLNVHTPQVRQNSVRDENATNLAVMVYLIGSLHGNTDNRLYDPSYLLDQEIVLVTVNYRYGYFGFFTTGDEAAPGNYGLKDVLEALNWLQRNIKAFGGDPDNVTLMGHGAEAGIVHLLALSEKSEGLFHKYVTQSGAAQSAWSYRPLEMAKNMSLISAYSMNCNQSTSEEIVKCMRDIPAFVRTDLDLYASMASPWQMFGPTREPESDDAVITEHPKTLMKDGKMRDIPWLTGVVADEGLAFSLNNINNSTICQELPEDFEDTVFWLANYRQYITDVPDYLSELELFYFHGNLTLNCGNGLSEMTGDMLVNWPVYESLFTQANNMESNVYFYNFAYNGTFTVTYEDDPTQRYGVCHEDELNYLFPILNNLFDDLQLTNTEDDNTVINIMTEMWANFAKTGVPNARLTPKWEPYNTERGYMEFGPKAEISMKKDFIQERMVFWYNLTEAQYVQEDIDLENEVSKGTVVSAFMFGDKNLHIFNNVFILLILALIPLIVRY